MSGELSVESFPNDWEVTTLGAVCERGGGSIQTGPFGSQLHASDYVTVGIPSVMPTNIGDNRIVDDGIVRITQADAIRLGQHRLQPGDIVYSRRGDVERRALVRDRENGWLCGTGCLKVRLGTGVADPLYASYFLGHQPVRAWIVRHAVGATMPNLNTSIMAAVPFALPPLPEQRAIASVLGALDDKIDLNRRMCQTLEEMARALFKSWFVDFDPVRAKMEGRDPGLPREIINLFPSRLVDSELGPIPEGWRVTALGEIAAPHRDLAQSNELDQRTNYIGLEHMPRRSITLADWSTSEAIESTKFRFAAGDILFGKLRPYFHKVGVAPTDGVCSTDIVVARPSAPEMFGLTIGVMSSNAFVAHTDRSSAGTRMPRTNWADMSAFKLVTPSRDVAEAHTQAVKSMIDRIVLSIHESRTLATLRDTLLPKLISGEVRVPASLSSMQELSG
jgi:type I restriction enzyme S subunit